MSAGVLTRGAASISGALGREGSTRPAALIRIGFMFLLWTSLTFPTSAFKWLDRPLLATCCLVLSVASVTLFVGFVSRISALLVALTSFIICWWFGAMEGVREFQGMTGVWLTAALLPALPVGGSFSVDRLLAVRRARRRGEESPPERAPIWGLYLIRLQLSAIYCFAAFDKIDPEWLDGERLERLVLNFYGYAELLRDQPWIHVGCVALAWFTTLTEFSLGVLVWHRPLRRFILPLGIILHMGFFVLLALWPLSQRMVLLYLAFLDPDDVHRLTDNLLRPHDPHEVGSGSAERG